MRVLIYQCPLMQVPINAAHLYDSVLIYAKALTEVLKLGGDIRNGTQIMKHIFNRTYNSIQGFDVRYSDYADILLGPNFIRISLGLY